MQGRLTKVPLRRQNSRDLCDPRVARGACSHLLRLKLALTRTKFAIILSTGCSHTTRHRTTLRRTGTSKLGLAVLRYATPSRMLRRQIHRHSNSVTSTAITILRRRAVRPFARTRRSRIGALSAARSISSRVTTVIKTD